MLLTVILLILGLVLIVGGAEILVDGASSVARKAGISEFVIGLTIVGIGTSAPEMVVSFLGAIEGNADVAIGNVIGSNIFNVLFITGITALILPLALSPDTKKEVVPVNIAVSLLVLALGMKKTLFGIGENTLGRLEGILMLVLFGIYMYRSLKNGRQDSDAPEGETKSRGTFVSIVLIICGIAALVAGGKLFVNSATSIARALHVSDKFVAITILAGGTSLPELATCVVAAVRKKGQLALGNVIGSNIFNILLILGGSAVITPLSLASITFVDMGVLILSSVLLLLAAYTGRNDKIGRCDATLFLLCYGAYIFWLFKHL